MSGSRTTGLRTPAIALVLACMAIALRVFVPHGYMVATTAPSGTIPIVLCTSQGAQTVIIDEAGQVVSPQPHAPIDQPGDQRGDSPCAFSGFGGAFAAQVPMLFATAHWTWIRQSIVVEPQTTPGRGLAAPPPPATGPPLQI